MALTTRFKRGFTGNFKPRIDKHQAKYNTLTKLTQFPNKNTNNIIQIFFDIESLVYQPFSAYALGYQIDDYEF